MEQLIQGYCEMPNCTIANNNRANVLLYDVNNPHKFISSRGAVLGREEVVGEQCRRRLGVERRPGAGFERRVSARLAGPRVVCAVPVAAHLVFAHVT